MYKTCLIALMIVTAAACGGGGAAAGPVDTGTGTGGGGTGGGTTAPASLTLSHTTASVAAGGTLQLSATPVDASGTAVSGLPAPSWSSSSPAVATVSTGGMVSGVGAGTATITATLSAGGATRTASATVTVTAAGGAAFTTLALSPAAGAVTVGGTLPLTATPRDQNGQAMAGLPAATFTTSSAAIATVSASGVVTGVAPGTATITGSLTSGGVTRTATASITVTGGGTTPPPTGGSSATVRGLEHAFSPASVTITPGGTVTWVMVDDEHDVTWTGAAPPGGNIPKMDEGESVTRTFPAAGTYTYRCARHENHNETGTVVVQGGSAAAVFTSVSVAPGSAGITAGGTAQLLATPLDQNGQAMSGLPAATWTSGSTGVATVSATGVVTGVSAGSATITASITSGGVTRTGTASITVTAGGGTTPPPPPPASPPAGSVTVTTPGEVFSPATVTIGVGGTVTWQISGATHNVTFGALAPAGGNIPDTRGATVSRQFSTAGNYDYACTRHAGMTGRVVVQ
jgi:plastocyanin